jgi:hypothetical protein
MATVKASLSHLERTADEPRDNVSSGLSKTKSRMERLIYKIEATSSHNTED